MPSAEVAMFLTEIYFARMYNAHLLFHKDTFLAGLGADRVPDFVALAVFASATRCASPLSFQIAHEILTKLLSSFLRQAPGKMQQLADGDGDGIELGLSLLSAADVRSTWSFATISSSKPHLFFFLLFTLDTSSLICFSV
jgi:hypothetical protein